MGRTTFLGSLALATTLAVTPSGEQAAGGRVVPAGRTLSTLGATDIGGSTRDTANNPLPDTRVQLRNLRTGTIGQSTTSDRLGEFAFRRVPAGHYVVEMTLSDGSVVAVSDAVVTTGIQAVQTVVRMVAPSRSFLWWFGSLTSMALSQASSLGVLAVTPGPPVSPQ